MSGLGIGFAAGLPLAQKLIRIGAILFVVLSIAGLSYCQGRTDGRNGERIETQKAINAALERDREAREKADRQRVQDDAATADTEEELKDAIEDAARVGADPAIALACERLRRLPARQRVSLPAECGRGSGDGAQARPRP